MRLCTSQGDTHLEYIPLFFVACGRTLGTIGGQHPARGKGAYSNSITNECARTTVRTLSTNLRLVYMPRSSAVEWGLKIPVTMGSTPIRVSRKARTAIIL